MTLDEIKKFKKLYGTTSDDDLAVALGISTSQVRRLAHQLSLGKDKRAFPSRGMPRWKVAEVALLKELYPTTPNEEVARQVGRTIKSVVSKAHNLKLKKTEARLREMGQENVRYRRDRQ